MRVSILLQITDDDGTANLAEEITAFEKQTERPENLGLSLAEGKTLTAAVQRRIVKAQAVSWAERHRCCEACGARRRSKGSSPVVFRSLYGDVPLASPRLHRCPCQDADGPATILRGFSHHHLLCRSRYRSVARGKTGGLTSPI